MKKVILALFFVSSLACNTDYEISEATQSEVQRKTDLLLYTKSRITGLCFAWKEVSTDVQPTNVPCTAEVLLQAGVYDNGPR